MARKRKWIDRKMLKELCLSQCSNDEIAGALRVSWDTLQRRYARAIKIWRGDGPMSVRRELYTTAIGDSKGKVPAMIFFLKNYGGMSDNNQPPRDIDLGAIPSSFRADDARQANKPN